MTKYARSSLDLVAPGNFVVEVWRDARLGDEVLVPDVEVLAGDGERRGVERVFGIVANRGCEALWVGVKLGGAAPAAALRRCARARFIQIFLRIDCAFSCAHTRRRRVRTLGNVSV